MKAVNALIGRYPLVQICQVLEISRSTQWRYRHRVVTMDKPRTEALNIFTQSRKSYGSRRLSEALKKKGYGLGRYATRTLMRDLGLVAKTNRRFVTTTQSNPHKKAFANSVNRSFTPHRVGVAKPADAYDVWFADITYINTKEGWLYLFALMDKDTRKILAHECAQHLGAQFAVKCIKTARLCLPAKQAVIHHSDRGSQYTADDFVEAATEGNIKLSMSRKGNCWDNAVMESFFATLKKEWIHGNIYNTRQQAKQDIDQFVYQYYNDLRLHSTLGYKTPNETNTLIKMFHKT